MTAETSAPVTLNNRIKRLALNLMIIVGGLWVLLCVALFLLQDSMIFVGRDDEPDAAKQLESRYPGAHTSLKVEDQVALEGWFIKEKDHTTKPLILYFGGNAENVVWFAHNKNQFRGFSLAAFNYRKYGKSQGKPSQTALFADALKIYDAMHKTHGFRPTKIIVVGRSLGTGVATYLASQRKVAKIILITPYDSIRAVAQGRFPFFPVGLLLRHPFDSIARAPSIDVPMLCILGERDGIIPPTHARRLAAKWKGRVTLFAAPDAGHNDISYAPNYWSQIHKFLLDS